MGADTVLLTQTNFWSYGNWRLETHRGLLCFINDRDSPNCSGWPWACDIPASISPQAGIIDLVSIAQTVVVQAFNLSTQEAEVGEFEAHLLSIVRPCLKKEREVIS